MGVELSHDDTEDSLLVSLPTELADGDLMMRCSTFSISDMSTRFSPPRNWGSNEVSSRLPSRSGVFLEPTTTVLCLVRSDNMSLAGNHAAEKRGVAKARMIWLHCSGKWGVKTLTVCLKYSRCLLRVEISPFWRVTSWMSTYCFSSPVLRSG